jgi:hypothetical protein
MTIVGCRTVDSVDPDTSAWSALITCPIGSVTDTALPEPPARTTGGSANVRVTSSGRASTVEPAAGSDDTSWSCAEAVPAAVGETTTSRASRTDRDSRRMVGPFGTPAAARPPCGC